MKVRIAVLAVLSVSLTLVFNFSATAQNLNPYEELVEQYICRCNSKVEMKSSGLENVRKAAAIAMLKSVFARNFRRDLISGMIRDGVEPKPYKVQLYINNRFYELTRSKEASL